LKQIRLWLLIDPIELALLVLNHFTLGEPQGDFLLGVLDTVGAMANVTTNILIHSQRNSSASLSPGLGFTHNGEVAPDGAWSGRERVGGTEKRC